MLDADRLVEGETESFVIRVWEEEPGCWRGRVRHVQSDAQRGFTRLSDLTAFVGQQMGVVSRADAPERSAAPACRLPAFPSNRGLRFAGAVAALLVVGLGLLLVAGPQEGTTLAGTATGGGIALDEVFIFLAGLAVGGVSVGLLSRRRGLRT